MKKLFILAPLAMASSAFAAVDAAVTTAITTASTDVVTVITALTVGGVAVFVARAVYKRFKI